ncbi:MAG: MBL fold metallo-hydrolase [Chloroflexi bacterium]|nr:MBL fold metallo-hydrolase [Chloroflexota bacterium]
MWFETIIREETGCAAYMIGCQRTNECMVFDPLWDVQPYIDMARKRRSTIKYIIDSHSHADHVSGGRRLEAITGAELILPELADIAYEARRVKHGDLIKMGGIGMEIVHVPGHRPEQINLLIYDYPRGDEPWCILTADFVLVGDVARPDLAQAGDEGAPIIYDVSIPRFLSLPDHVEVYPGHLAGST